MHLSNFDIFNDREEIMIHMCVLYFKILIILFINLSSYYTKDTKLKINLFTIILF